MSFLVGTEIKRIVEKKTTTTFTVESPSEDLVASERALSSASAQDGAGDHCLMFYSNIHCSAVWVRENISIP